MNKNIGCVLNKKIKKSLGFTIVELLVVIVVIGILAAITIVSYSGITNRATIASLQVDLANSSKKLKMYHALYGSYPTMSAPDASGEICPTAPTVDNNYCIKPSSGISFSYATDSDPDIAYVLIANKGPLSYRVSNDTSPVSNNLPSSPVISSVTPNGVTQITINWTAPTFDGGSGITGYKIYRGLSAGSLSLAYSVGNVLSYVDNTGISIGNTYYYKVLAVNSNGDGSYSNELSGMPVSVAATGGDITMAGGYKYHTFTSNGVFNVTNGGNVDVFIVGAGGGGYAGGGGGGGGYTKTFKADTSGYRDGPEIAVTSGQSIPITIGTGASFATGGYSEFLNSTYRANGGLPLYNAGWGGHGGSGGGGYGFAGGSDGGVGSGNGSYPGGNGQGHTTRAFGDAAGTLYASGGHGSSGSNGGANTGNGGGGTGSGGSGGSGVVIVRYVSQ